MIGNQDEFPSRKVSTSNFRVAHLTGVLAVTSLRAYKSGGIHNSGRCSSLAADGSGECIFVRNSTHRRTCATTTTCQWARHVSDARQLLSTPTCHAREPKLEAVIRGQVHAGQHNSGITRTAAYDARRPYQGYDLRWSASHWVLHTPPPSPIPISD